MHVYNRGVDGMRLFYTDEDYDRFLRFLAAIKGRSSFEVFAYCLMPNHFHLLLRVLATHVSSIMHALQCRYAIHLNRQLDRRGPVYQNRFKSPLCHTDAHLLQLVRYINQNPIPALVSKPEDWKWSSHHDFLGNGSGLTDTSFPLSLFGENRAAAVADYLEFMGEPCPSEIIESVEEALSRAERQDEKDVQLYKIESVPLNELAKTVSLTTGCSIEAMKSKSQRRLACLARKQLILAALQEGHLPVEIAAFINRSQAIVSRVTLS